MINLYFHATPNSMKVVLLLEELQLPYAIHPIDIMKGDQHEADFLKINPNGKVPALIDDGVLVFDSHAILLHLAYTRNQFVPSSPRDRAAVLSWLQMVATGLSPFCGQAVHFLHYAPEDLPYAKTRYVREVERHYRVLDERLSSSSHLGGADYGIADMALWGWAISAKLILGDGALARYRNVERLVKAISARPAAIRAWDKRAQASFKSDLDARARRAMFPQNDDAVA